MIVNLVQLLNTYAEYYCYVVVTDKHDKVPAYFLSCKT